MVVWPNILLVLLGGILTLRLVIWQFFLTTEVFFRDEFSNLAVALLIVLVSIVWLIFKIFDRQPFKKSGLELPVFLLITAAACSLLGAPDFSTSLKGVLVLGAEITFFYMLQDLLNTPSRLRSFLIFLLGMAFVVSVYGIITFFAFWARHPMAEDIGLLQTDRSLYYLLTHHRAISFFGWPNVLAGYLLLFLPSAIILPFHLKKAWQKAMAVIALFTAAVCFMYTLSFLGWLSFLLSTAVLLPFFWKNLGVSAWPKEKKRMLLYAALAFLMLFLLLISRKNFLMSLSPRMFYYKAAFSLLAQNPLLGYGWDSFGILCRLLTKDTNNLSLYIHNSYLQIWLETGIIGLLGIVLLVVNFFRKSFVILNSSTVIPAKAGIHNNWIFIAVAWGLMAFFIDNLFSFTILAPNIAIYCWTMLAVFCAMLKSRDKSRDRHDFLLRKVVPVTTFLVLAVSIFLLLARIVGGYAFYYKAMAIKKPGTYNTALEILDRAKVLDPWSSYLPAGAGSIHLEEYAAKRLENSLKLASNDYLEAVRRSPRVYYNYFVLSKIYGQLGDNARGQAYTQKAMIMSPAEFNLDNTVFHQSDPQK